MLTVICDQVASYLRDNWPVADGGPLTTDELDTEAGIRTRYNKEVPPGPPATAGERFILIYGSDWSPGSGLLNGYSMQAFDESFDFTVSITYRVADMPEDRWWEVAQDIEADLRTTIQLLTINRWTLFANINTAIDAGSYKFWKPYEFMGADPQPMEVGPSWWSPYDDNEQTGPEDLDDVRAMGLVQNAYFGRMERIQELSQVYGP